MTAYYNEIDPFAAEWLRQLIKAGHIASGIVDERSIEDVTPDDLSEFTQCHFFAGIGVWSRALRLAGWPDNRPVWTGSCPCQPFSSAGKGTGFDDERHLWPSFYWLIEQCRPAVVFGEQVASKATGAWFDLVQADLERMGYAFGCVPFPSASVGAPHIRDRAYWVADSGGEGLQRQRGLVGLNGSEGRESPERYGSESGLVRGLADSEREQHKECLSRPPKSSGSESSGQAEQPTRFCGDSAANPTNGLWRDSDWLFCRDGKWRPVEPGSFPLANGITNRMGRLRGYGNAINAEAAKTFIEAYCASVN